MTSRQKPFWVWAFAAILAPALLIGMLLGAMANADTATERIPVALVNNDEILIDEDEDGEETFFLASRPLVLELVGGDDISLDWVVTDSEQAADMLERGDVYATFEIPADFSEKVRTLETDDPEQATFIIRTNPARSYLAGILAEQIGVQVATALNKEFGKEVLDGLFTVIADLGDAFAETADASREIADGVWELSDGVWELSDGVGELRDGTGDLVSGYREFDDGVTEYLDGVGQLADGLSTFERETRALNELTNGVRDYGDGVSGLVTILRNLDDNFPGLIVTIENIAPVDFDFLKSLEDGGTALTAETDKAVKGIQSGLRDSRDGARELADAGGELADGSEDVLSGVIDLDSGVRDLDDGVDELAEGVEELADGVQEFADSLTEAAEELEDELPGEVSDASLVTLVSPVESSLDEGTLVSGVEDSLTAIIVPLGLWLSSLLLIVVLPAPTLRVLGSTVSSTKLLVRNLGPTIVMALTQSAVALALVHSLGGVSISALGWTVPLVVAASLSFVSLHFAGWAWRPKAVVPLSIAALVAQIATFGVVLPLEILPTVYQAVGGWGPVSWLADALLAASSGDVPARMAGPLIGLLLTAVIALFVSRALFGRRRHALVRNYFLTGSPN